MCVRVCRFYIFCNTQYKSCIIIMILLFFIYTVTFYGAQKIIIVYLASVYIIMTLLRYCCGHVRSIIILLKVLSPIKQANKKYNYKIIIMITMQNDTKEKMWL